MLDTINRGKQITFINGITGINPGGSSTVNMDVNKRFHALIFQCAMVNYTGGTALTTKALTGAGTGATLTIGATNGVPTSVAIVSGGSGYAAADTITVNDATGTGGVWTVGTVSSGAITAITYNAGSATASPVYPASMITGCKLLVNGINMRDIPVADIIRISQANGINSQLGEFPIVFTEEWRNIVRANDANSWDLAQQGTFQIQLQIAPGVLLPSLIGVEEFDFQRNTYTPKGAKNPVPYLEPVSQHYFTYNAVGGINNINTLPFNFPIGRVWIYGSNPGNISQLEVYQDGNKILEATTAQLKERYARYGFQFGQTNFLNSNQTNQAPKGFNPLSYYEAAFISDPDQRYTKALKCKNSFLLRVYSGVAQTLNIVIENLPGAYQA